MDSSIRANWTGPCFIEGVEGWCAFFNIYLIFYIFFQYTNSVDPDKTRPVASDLGLTCLTMTLSGDDRHKTVKHV